MQSSIPLLQDAEARNRRRWRRIPAHVALAISIFPGGAGALPVSYGGRLVDGSGAPLQGPVQLEISFYDAETGGTKLGASPYLFASTRLDQGVFSITLELSDSDASSIFSNPGAATWIEVTDRTNGNVYPRQRFASVPFALKVPVDGDNLVFSADGKLTIDRVGMSQVDGLADALAAKLGETPASSTAAGYLSAADWTRFDAKQPAISEQSSVAAGSLSTAQQSGLLLKPFGGGAGQTGELRFVERSGGNYVGFKAADSIATDFVWTLPAGDGAAGQVLSTDGSGALTWATPAGAGDMLGSANLSDLADAIAARANLGLGSLATASAVTSTEITDGTITDGDISGSAAIADTKLATISTAGKVSGAAITFGSIAGTAAFAGSGGIATTGAITGTGNFHVSGTGAATTELRFGDNDNSSYVGFKAPGTVAANRVWTLPETDGGAGQFLSTNGAGALSWSSPAGGGDMMASNNLSDLTSVATAHSNLGLGSLATASAVTTAEITDGTIGNADISATAAIATSKLSGAITAISGHGLGALASLSTIASSEIVDGSVSSTDVADGTLTDADISGSAAIATSKLFGSLTAISGHGLGTLATLSAIGSTEISDGAIADADVSVTAAIATSKLSGAVTSINGHGLGSLAALNAIGASEITDGSIADADISGAAAISSTKINFVVGSVSGSAINGGTISNFASTGIDDNASSLAMTIDSSGNVGIGTTTPIGKFNVAGTAYLTSKAYFDGLAGAVSSGPAMYHLGNTSGASPHFSIKYNWTRRDDSNPLTAAEAGVYGRDDATYGRSAVFFDTSGSLSLATEDSATAAANTAGHPATRLTVHSGGNVGIGTTAPAGLLDVNGKLTVLSGGSVGIGTTSPGYLLHVRKDSDTLGPSLNAANETVHIGIKTGGCAEALAIGLDRSAGSAYGAYLQGKNHCNVGLSVPVLLNPLGGNVGIGTTTPGGRLDVGSASQFRVSSTGDLTKINNVTYSWPSAQGAAATTLTNDGSGNLSWSSGGSSQWTTSASNIYYSAGNVGVGTTNPTAKLHVEGDIAASGTGKVLFGYSVQTYANAGGTAARAACPANSVVLGGGCWPTGGGLAGRNYPSTENTDGTTAGTAAADGATAAYSWTCSASANGITAYAICGRVGS